MVYDAISITNYSSLGSILSFYLKLKGKEKATKQQQFLGFIGETLKNTAGDARDYYRETGLDS
jgi:hypothetical protein